MMKQLPGAINDLWKKLGIKVEEAVKIEKGMETLLPFVKISELRVQETA